MDRISPGGLLTIILCVCLAAGCSLGPQEGDAHGPLEPADFVMSSAAEAVRAAGEDESTLESTSGALPAELPDEQDTVSLADPIPQPVEDAENQLVGLGQSFTVDAMVGQVNGQPIYAGKVLEPISEQLAALGRSLPRGQFRVRAQNLIESRLAQMVADSLILGAAEGDLSAQEQAGLLNMLKQQREELIRFWGRGSVALAEDSLARHTSRSLDQTITETRQQLLVQRYLRQKLWPKVNVTRKDVDRYYNDHIDQYNPPPARTLRLIYVEGESEAQQIDQQLKQGIAFKQIASSELNQYRVDDSGLMSQKALGNQVFGQAQLNEAMLGLQAGEHSRRIEAAGRYWWIHVDAIEQAKGRSISEVQLEIEQLLTRQRFQQLTQRYREELFATGSFNRIDVMGNALLSIAMSRFANVR